jgi:hypothetical protein
MVGIDMFLFFMAADLLFVAFILLNIIAYILKLIE